MENNTEKKASFFKKHIFKILFLALSFLGVFLFCSALWYTNTFRDVGFDAIIFTLKSPIAGTQPGLLTGFLLWALLPSVLITILLGFLFFCSFWGKIKFFPLKKKFVGIFSSILSFILIALAAFNVGLPKYIYSISHESVFFEHNYVDPDSVEIKFPEKKRNLIYIFLESMETTYLSQDEGGAMQHNLIPELYQLAENNITFNDNKGYYVAPGASWTVASMVAQSSGIPLNSPELSR